MQPEEGSQVVPKHPGRLLGTVLLNVLLNLNFFIMATRKKLLNPNAITFYIIIIFTGYVKLKRIINSSVVVYI